MKGTLKYLVFVLIFSMMLIGCAPEGDLIPDGDGSNNVTDPTEHLQDSESDTESESETESDTESGGGTESEFESEEEEEIFVDHWNYSMKKGVKVREVVIDTGKGGDPIDIIQLTDIHINYCNEEDLKDPVLKSTYDNRKWLKNFQVQSNLERCLAFAEDADQLVITGDLYDYLSMGAIEKAQEYVFDPYPNVLATLGNHESVRQMQGTVPENTTLEERMEILEETWCHDIYYESRVLGEKVMLIAMDNASAGGIGAFHDSQVPLLEADLALARENGYAVLLFYHIPISTGNPADTEVYADYVGDITATQRNFYSYSACIGINSSGASGRIYNMIVSNADIIKGAFCGHHHSDFYTEIVGSGADGSLLTIPQYSVTGVSYGNGQVMKITVK